MNTEYIERIDLPQPPPCHSATHPRLCQANVHDASDRSRLEPFTDGEAIERIWYNAQPAPSRSRLPDAVTRTTDDGAVECHSPPPLVCQRRPSIDDFSPPPLLRSMGYDSDTDAAAECATARSSRRVSYLLNLYRKTGPKSPLLAYLDHPTIDLSFSAQRPYTSLNLTTILSLYTVLTLNASCWGCNEGKTTLRYRERNKVELRRKARERMAKHWAQLKQLGEAWAAYTAKAREDSAQYRLLNAEMLASNQAAYRTKYIIQSGRRGRPLSLFVLSFFFDIWQVSTVGPKECGPEGTKMAGSYGSEEIIELGPEELFAHALEGEGGRVSTGVRRRDILSENDLGGHGEGICRGSSQNLPMTLLPTTVPHDDPVTALRTRPVLSPSPSFDTRCLRIAHLSRQHAPTSTLASTPTLTPTQTQGTQPQPQVVQPMSMITISIGRCLMPYYPDVGIDIDTHLQDAHKYFYVVKEGRVKGTFTNNTIATSQTRHFSNSRMHAVPTVDGACREREKNCCDSHGAVCPDIIGSSGGYFQGPMPTVSLLSSPSPTPSDHSALSVDTTLSVDSFGSSQLSDAAAGVPMNTASHPPITDSTRITLVNDEVRRLDKGKYWGVPGVLSTFGRRIHRPNVWGHHDKRVVDDFIMTSAVEAEPEY
ncbi:hypothetical protein B0H16DRAFT_1469540 [Mycena metata]|uniref:Uncharacterized protein n=1 Tax=Mycena metata TaxID=1033252 RepID=A0AAD7MSY5_9AGAR|nr:hypothetical protein B0H16DRAFT_1469540 [Mycena metata]